MMVMTDDEIVEMLLVRAEAQGRDMTMMRAARIELSAMEVGESTPPHGTLRELPPDLPAEFGWVRDATILDPPVIYEGMNETPEGKFLVHPSLRIVKERHVTFRELCHQVRTLRRVGFGSLLAVTMYAITATIVAVVNW